MNGLKVLRRGAEGLSHLIYPDNIYCICCGRIMDPRFSYGFCGNCAEHLLWADGLVCERCGRPLSEETGEILCGMCSSGKTAFTGGCTLFRYGRAEREMIHRFKYNGCDYYGKKFAELLCAQVRRQGFAADVAAPVPMFRKKELQRGYNQASVLGRPLAEELHIPWEERLLIRIGETRAMSILRKEEREDNVRGMFALSTGRKEKIRGKAILLVDDIMTTGSTLSACARILLDNGAEAVYTATIAAVADMGN